MAYFVRTALGRLVPVEDVQSAREDLVLLVLHRARTSPFNASNAPVSLTGLADATGLSPAIVESTCESLQGKGQVESVPNQPEKSYRITGEGFGFVETSVPLSGSADW
jgi:predicted transcriptional regulator